MFDNYFVDGQALDPSYFGYYKDGRGYTSQGSPRSTSGIYSQNNGAWHPLPPSAVKKKIESKGGFGTNGFYLPMNSANHPGTDFHIEPDTILKLKTDEQQPKAEIKGISEYRDDPYKGNLVELNCKLIIEAPENIKNKMRSEIVMAIVFKIIDTKLTPDEIKKIVLVTIPSENFDFIKSVVTDLFQKSGFKNFNFNKEINFEALYNQQKTN